MSDNFIIKEKQYIIRESNTHFVDGWYKRKDSAEIALQTWKERRPEYDHWIEEVWGKDIRYLRDHELLNRNHDYNS